MLRIETVYQTKNRCFLAAKPAEHIGILVHSTGANNKNLKRYVDAPELVGVNANGNHWNNLTGDKCMHAFIGLDKAGEVMAIQTLPYEYACWGCGSGKRGSYNYDPTAHIQFEICQGSDTDALYYRRAIEAAEEYCAQLCKLFGFTAENIVSHREASRRGYASKHDDPEEWMENFGDDMNQFRARVAARLAEGKEEAGMMKYKVTGTRLALREKPSTSAAVLLRMETGTVVGGEPAGTEWVKISYGGKTGYSMAKFLQAMETVAPVAPGPVGPDPLPEMTDKEKLDALWAWYLKEKEAGS